MSTVQQSDNILIEQDNINTILQCNSKMHPMFFEKFESLTSEKVEKHTSKQEKYGVWKKEEISPVSIDKFLHSLNFPGKVRTLKSKKNSKQAIATPVTETTILIDSSKLSSSQSDFQAMQTSLGSNKHEDIELDRNMFSKIEKLNYSINDNRLESIYNFKSNCTILDNFIKEIDHHMPTYEKIKVINVDPKIVDVTQQINEIVQNIKSVQQINVNKGSKMVQNDGDLFPLDDEITEILRIMHN